MVTIKPCLIWDLNKLQVERLKTHLGKTIKKEPEGSFLVYSLLNKFKISEFSLYCLQDVPGQAHSSKNFHSL